MKARRRDFVEMLLIRAPINRPMIMWPAIILAASRSARVNGRIKNLRTSINPITGARASGRPLPTRLANFLAGFLLEARTLASQSGRATATVNTRCLEMLITQGTRPARLIATNIKNNDVRSQPTP